MKTVIAFFFVVFSVIFALYLATVITPESIGGSERAQLVRDTLTLAVVPLWHFARPLLQLALLLFIVKAAVDYFGGRWSLEAFGIQWDIRALIAIIVVSVFSVAALAGSDATSALKDVALVVIGFYFGQSNLGQPGTSSASNAPTTIRASGAPTDAG